MGRMWTGKRKAYRRLPARIAALAAAAAFLSVAVGMGGVDVRAAENRTGISQICLNVASGIVPGSSGGSVSVTAVGGNFRVGSVEILNADDDWMGGMTPRVSVELYADQGYYFSEAGRKAFTFTGDDASFVTARRTNGNGTLALTIKLDKLENGDLTVTGARWEESDGTAVWDYNPRAKRYEVRMYRGNSSVTSIRTTSENYYDFGGSITRRGDYYFEVRAVGSGAEKGDWISSDSWYVSAAEADDLSGRDYSDGPGGSAYNSNRGPGVSNGYDNSYNGGPGAGSAGGYGSGPGIVTGSGNHWCLDQYGWWYQFANGSYPYSCWLCIDNKWYCFNESGYIRYGWILHNGLWYYCGPDGALMANTRTPDGYYVGEGGIWISS